MNHEQRYEWRDGMGEISGLGGDYEAACRRMLRQGLAWLDAHPKADPQFSWFKCVYGLVIDDNDDAKALFEAICEGVDPTGAMHQAVVGACLFVREHGWEAYCAAMAKETIRRKGSVE
jgi:hypothetical protein